VFYNAEYVYESAKKISIRLVHNT